jgi:hypothetical protein
MNSKCIVVALLISMLFLSTGVAVDHEFVDVSKSFGVWRTRNMGGKNHWLKVKLKGTKSNADAIGAWLTLPANCIPPATTSRGNLFMARTPFSSCSAWAIVTRSTSLQ